MSLDALRENARARMMEKRDMCVTIMTAQQFRPASIVNGAALPAQTLEEIAVKTVECNAMIRSYTEALKILDEEYKKIVDPGHGTAEGEDNDEEPVY